MKFESIPIPWEQPSQRPRPKRAGMLVDLRRCIGCHGCSVSCKTEHAVPLGSFRTRVHWIQQPGRVQLDFVPLMCNQCTDAPCITACDSGAITRAEDGRVTIDEDVCESGQGCVSACPYDAITVHPQTGKADKCDFCEQRTDDGMNPACVDACPTQALVFGDLDDPEDPVSRAAARPDSSHWREDTGAGPAVVYLGANSQMEKAAPKVQLGDGEAGIVYAQPHDRHLRLGDQTENAEDQR